MLSQMTNIVEFLKKLPSFLLSSFVPALLFLSPLIWSQYLNSNFTSTKLLFLFLGASLSILHWAFNKKLLPFPRVPYWVKWVTLIILCYQLVTPAAQLDWAYYLYIFKFLAFVTLIIYFYNSDFKTIEEFFKKTQFIILAIALGIIYFSAKNYYLLRVERMTLDSGIFISSFGNVNMLAEFLVLTAPLIWVWQYYNDKVPKIIKSAILVCWIFFLLFSYSRSTYIGLIIWPLLMLRDLKRRDYLVIAVSIGLFAVHWFAPSNNVIAKKVESTAERESIYSATFELITDYPLGIGIGTYVNELVPYMIPKKVPPQEFTYPDQPHSEILKWAVQFGWVGLIFSLAFLWYVTYTVFINPFRRKRDPTLTQKFLFGSFLTLLPQLTFQFPFENPASTIYMALLFALWMLSLPRGTESFKITNKVRAAALVFCFVSLAHTAVYLISVYLESNYVENPEKMKIACDIYPINIRSCYSKNFHLIKQKKLVEARISLDEHFTLNPISGDYLRTIPLFYQTVGNEKALCEAILVYKTIYPAQIYYQQKDLTYCKERFKPAVEYANPRQFRKDYAAWIFGLLRN